MRRSVCSEPVPLLFDGYSAATLVRWCGVSRRTALAYKRGSRVPSVQTVRLFVLHRDRRVLTPEWERGWVVTSTGIVDPEGKELPRAWVRGYFLLLQWARSLSRERGLSAEYERRLAAVPGGTEE